VPRSRVSGAGVQLAVTELGAGVRDGDRVAVVLHGVGSSAEFALRCLGGALADEGWGVVAPDQRGHGESTRVTIPGEHTIDHYVADLGAVVVEYGATLVAGISLGAHVAAAYAARAPLDAVALCLPSWIDWSEPSAGNHRALGAEVARAGAAGSLARARAAGVTPWVVDEVEAGWNRCDPVSLTAALTAVGHHGPTAAALTAITCPAAVVGCVGDLAHPVEAASDYAGAIPRSALETITLEEWGADRGALGRAAVRALTRVLTGPR
jgi:pimeloyl-ACP methyl ester carboxylesterase